MTRAQALRLRTRRGPISRQYARDLTFEETERRINILKAEIALADSF